MVEVITVPISGLHSAFVVQSGINAGDVWITDSGASCHMTHDMTRRYDLRPPPSVRKAITIGDRRKVKVECVGNIDVSSNLGAVTRTGIFPVEND